MFLFVEHRKQFEQRRKKHYNEFEVVRLYKKEIEAELHALEHEEEAMISDSNNQTNSVYVESC